MQPAGVHHVGINVEDLEDSRNFYVDVLGLTVREDRPELGIDGAWLDAGGTQVHLLVAPVVASRGQHFALRVDDLDGVVRELRGRGVEVGDPAQVGGDLQTFVQDPSGNVVELHQVGTDGTGPEGPS